MYTTLLFSSVNGTMMSQRNPTFAFRRCVNLTLSWMYKANSLLRKRVTFELSRTPASAWPSRKLANELP